MTGDEGFDGVGFIGQAELGEQVGDAVGLGFHDMLRWWGCSLVSCGRDWFPAECASGQVWPGWNFSYILEKSNL